MVVPLLKRLMIFIIFDKIKNNTQICLMFIVEKMNTNGTKCTLCDKTIYTADKYEKYEGKVCFIKINLKKIFFLFFLIDLS
jgi:hypothetical protein